jgi:acetyltransferase
VPIAAGDRQRLTTLDALVAELSTRTAAAQRAVSDLRPSQHTVGAARVTVRPLSREDAPLEAEFVRSLSAESRYMRFQAALRELPPAKLRFLTDVDQQRHVALAATVQRDGGEAIVGVARYAVDDDGGDCEFAIAVRDDWQRTGVAGLLMQRLIDVARARGLRSMHGSVLASNARMLKFMRQLGFAAAREPGDATLVRVTRAL